jgi:type I restriction enzyme S subunit
MSGFPASWFSVKLGEVAEFKYGKALPAAVRDGGEFPVFGSNGVVGQHSMWLSPAPTIVIGRKGSVGEVCFSEKNCSPIDTTYYVDSFEFFEPKFCFYLLKTLRLGDLNKSTAIPGLNRQDAYDLEVGLPPLAEQTRIAAKLDELLAQVDTLKARIDGIPALLKRFRQSVLAAAVSGRLTEEWRASSPVSESAEEYLARVIQSRRQHPVVKFKEPVSPDLEKREIEVPQGWIVASVSSFAECLDSMRVPVKKELRKSGEGKYPYFGANGEVDRVDEYIFDDDLVLVTEDETFYGREKPIAYKYSGRCWVNNHVHALRAHDSVARDYLCYALMHYDVIPWLTGTTGRAKLTQGALLSLPLQVPPSAEQTEIVRRVEQLFAFADQLEAKISEAKTRIDRLILSILAKAFRGELVPQDPSDEPASALLERIQAQRASAPKARRERRKAEA